jgi:uncharacterized protein YndB with AHSA1/START domain
LLTLVKRVVEGRTITPGSSESSPGSRAATLIELDFEERDGITTVRFTHSGLWDEEAVRSHDDGWRKLFDKLERTLEAARSGR